MPNRPLRMFLSVGIAAGLLVGLPLGMPVALAKDKKDASWPARDFLPPVATINPRIDEAAIVQDDNDEPLEVVSLAGVSSPVLHASPKVDRLTGRIGAQFKTEQLQSLREIQQTLDEANLEHLWQATVERNPVIRFSLEKLATPADLQPKQSSKFLSKTLSTLISGAAMAATMMPGGGAYRDMGTMAVGNALQNMVGNRTPMTPGSLSATEQIQLAGLIDELKLKLIQSYQDYRNTLQSLAQSHEITMKNNNMYSKALASKNDLAIMAAGTAYYQARMNETKLRQKAKLHRMTLERLAGQDAVSDLELALHLPDAPNSPATASLDSPPANNLAPAEEPPAMLLGPGMIIDPEPTSQDVPTNVQNELPPAAAVKPADEEANAPAALLPQPMELAPSLEPEAPIGPPEPEPVKDTTQSHLPPASHTLAHEDLLLPLPDAVQIKEELIR